LQRQKFLSAVDLIIEYLNVYKLEGAKDYRISLISDFDNNSKDIFNEKKIKTLYLQHLNAMNLRKRLI
jgi:predicted ATPase